MHDDDPDI